MANKFQKSVQERLDEENKQINKYEIQKEPIQNLVKDVPIETSIIDISKYLHKEPQRDAKNKTFYLDIQVIDAVKSMAKKQNITDSRLVNDILRHLLSL